MVEGSGITETTACVISRRSSYDRNIPFNSPGNPGKNTFSWYRKEVLFIRSPEILENQPTPFIPLDPSLHPRISTRNHSCNGSGGDGKTRVKFNFFTENFPGEIE
jgi:hypothetical protein